MNDVNVSEFTEKSYKLDSIGIENSYLVIEENKTFITDYQNYDISVDGGLDLVCCKESESTFVMHDAETKYVLQITNEQYNLLKNLIEGE